MSSSGFITRVRDELMGFSKREQQLLLGGTLALFCVTFIYAICRPISNSFFVSTYGSKFYPYAWLAVVPFNYLAVSLFNRFVSKIGCLRIFFIIIGLIISLDLFAAFLIDKFHSLPFIYYVWKEIYILLLFHQTWAVIHSAVDVKRSKYLYGVFFSFGGLGGLLGSGIVMGCTSSITSGPLLLASIPACLFLTYLYTKMVRVAGAVAKSQQVSDVKTASQISLRHGINLIMRSPLLFCILGIVVFMQLATALIDYQFYTHLGKAFATTDLRTQYSATAFTIINAVKFPLQLFGAYLLIKFIGVRRTHLVSPIILAGHTLAFLFFPTFAVISASFISLKTLDFSIFGISKESLYVKLTPEEKFQAKSVIDIFAYRSAKAIGSFLIIGFSASQLVNWVHSLTLIILATLTGWILFVALSFKSELVENVQEEAVKAPS